MVCASQQAGAGTSCKDLRVDGERWVGACREAVWGKVGRASRAEGGCLWGDRYQIWKLGPFPGSNMNSRPKRKLGGQENPQMQFEAGNRVKSENKETEKDLESWDTRRAGDP